MYESVLGERVHSPRNEQTVTRPEDVSLLVQSSLHDGNTTIESSVKTVDTNEDELECDFLKSNCFATSTEEQSPGDI